MKEKVLNQRGITLIALIITIIVLVILAAVSIRAVTNEISYNLILANIYISKN